MIVLIDADSLCYANAFAMEKDGELIHNAEIFLYARLDKAIDAIVRATEAKDYKVFLTSGGGYRLGEVCENYKANRAGMKRPILLEQAREYLTVVHNALVSDYYEADDVVCMEQTFCLEHGIETCIAHIDKDIDQQEGWHYRWPVGKKKGEMYYVSKTEGLRNLYTQALMGDKADNIMYYLDETTGTWKKDYGLGAVGARKLLEDLDTEQEMYEAVLDAYSKMTKKSDGKTPDAHDLFINMSLLYMCREEDVFWIPPYETIETS